METYKNKLFDFPKFVKENIETSLMYLKIFSPNKEKIQRINETMEYLFQEGQLYYASQMFDAMLNQEGV